MKSTTKATRSDRLQSAARLALDEIASCLRPGTKPHILLACMPKSGSTFLTTALSEYPGLRSVRLVPDHGRREQELCPIQLSRHNRSSYVAQLHIRNSDWTQHLIAKYRLTPVVLVRNLADVVVSFRHHLRAESPDCAMAFLTEHHAGMSDADLEATIVRLVMPWYVNFYVGWRTDPNALILNYEDIATDPSTALLEVLEHAGMSASREAIEQALERTGSRNVRFNVGISGRGKFLAPQAAKALLSLLDCYPALKDDPLFQQTRETLADDGHLGRSSAAIPRFRVKGAGDDLRVRADASIGGPAAIPPGPRDAPATAPAGSWRWLERPRIEAAAFWSALFDRRVRWYVRSVLPLSILGYLIIPVDPIPDRLPVIGHLDDAIMTVLSVWVFMRLVPKWIMSQHRSAAAARLNPTPS